MSSPASPPSRGLPFLLLLLALAAPALALAQKTIPATDANQDYFARTQALFAFGTKSTSSCGSEIALIEDCVKSCNRPGLQERSGCCCVAKPTREFFVGIRGGCRYRQQLLNFTSRLLYVSQPIRGRGRFFDEVSCAASAVNVTGGSCTCSIKWEASTEDLQLLSPLPSPTPSLTPGLSPIAKPSQSAEPIIVVTETPEVGETDPPVDPDTPEPSEGPIVVPIPTVAAQSPGPAVPGPTDEPGVETDGPDTTDDGTVGVIPGTGEGEGEGEGELDGESPGPTDDDLDLAPTGEDGDGDGEGVGTTGDVSPTPTGVTTSPTPEDDGTVCVDEQHLIAAGVPRDDMVHAVGIRQRVLCPRVEGLPCGTPNHKVRRLGRGLSYRQLCQEVDCDHSVAVVNSVYSHVWEESVHGDVTLTMFDVSYPETAQIALHSVMRAGRRSMRRVMGMPVGL